MYKYRAVYQPSLASTLKDIYMCNANSISELTHQHVYNLHINLVKTYHVRESILKVATVSGVMAANIYIQTKSQMVITVD